MPLRAVDWPRPSYNSRKVNILEGIVLPMLSNATKYDRSVGYLEASHLADAAEGLFEFAERGGKARFLIGNPLSYPELNAAEEAFKQSIEDGASPYLENLRLILNSKLSTSSRESINLVLLQYLLASDSLNIKLVLREAGMHHPKVRIARDDNGDVVTTNGSDNDSNSALTGKNREQGSLAKSWAPHWEDYGQPVVDDFEDDWNGVDRESILVDLSQQIKLKIHDDWQARGLTVDDLRALLEISAIEQKGHDLYEHQEKAIEAWYDHGHQGILAHCTGAGKTYTSLYIARELANQFMREGYSFVFVVAVPFQILGEQWASQITEMGFPAIRCWSENPNWDDQLLGALTGAFSGRDSVQQIFVVTVNDTLRGDRFQELLKKIPSDLLFFVGDEVHRHGSESYRGKIPSARMKLGLSATPWASFESEREMLLKEFYGPVIHEFGMKQALDSQVLCPYTYTTVTAPLNYEEAEYYARETKEIAKIVAEGLEHLSYSQKKELSYHYRIRSGILGTCGSKFAWLEKETSMRVHPRTLFYCSDGRTERQDPNGTDQRAILAVGEILGKNGWNVAKITAEESAKKRRINLYQFANTSIDAILAIKVLDEGFDLPSCERAYLLASSTNERQFIQRRGRVLRQSPGTGKSRAELFDFLVIPPEGDFQEPWAISLVESELIRCYEFARFAVNKTECLETLKSIAKKAGIDFSQIELKVDQRNYSDEIDIEVEV